MYYIYQIGEKYLSIERGDANPTDRIINNYMRTVQVSIFSAGFPLFRSRGDKKNQGATIYVSREKHSQFPVMETEPWKPEKARRHTEQFPERSPLFGLGALHNQLKCQNDENGCTCIAMRSNS